MSKLFAENILQLKLCDKSQQCFIIVSNRRLHNITTGPLLSTLHSVLSTFYVVTNGTEFVSMCITRMINCKTCDVVWGTYMYARYMYKGRKTYAVISLQWGSLCPERRCLYRNGAQVVVTFYNIPINQIVNPCTSPTKLRLLLQDQAVVPGTSLLGQSMTQWCLSYISQSLRYHYQDLNHQNVSINHKIYTL